MKTNEKINFCKRFRGICREISERRKAMKTGNARLKPSHFDAGREISERRKAMKTCSHAAASAQRSSGTSGNQRTPKGNEDIACRWFPIHTTPRGREISERRKAMKTARVFAGCGHCPAQLGREISERRKAMKTYAASKFIELGLLPAVSGNQRTPKGNEDQ